jgi:predicted nucleotidyltransferase
MQTWRSFKTEAGNGHFQTAFQAIDTAIERLTAQRNGEVTAIILYGSLARRRSTYDDIDLFIIVKPGLGSISEVTRRLAEQIFGPIFLEYGELFSFVVYTPAQFTQLRDILQLLDDIQREGVLLYGENPFTKAAGSRLSSDRVPSISDG